MLKVFEAFAGYGSQSLSLKYSGIEHEVIGISEIEPDSIIAYASIRFDLSESLCAKYFTREEMQRHLKSKNVGWDFKKQKSCIDRMKQSKLEQLFKADILTNNFGDISILDPEDLPDFDYFTYSFPCQDVSVRGKTEGIKRGQTRSGLLYECEKIIEHKRPKYLLMENVKNLVGKKFKQDFDSWCVYLENLGYSNFYNILNAKDFGIAQNRERVFMISILDCEKDYVFPSGHPLDKKLKDFLEDEVDEKYYLKNQVLLNTLNEDDIYVSENKVKNIGNVNPSKKGMNGNVFSSDGLSPTLTTNKGEGPKIVELPCAVASRGRNPRNPSDRTVGVYTEQRLEINSNGVINTLTSVQKDNYILEKRKD